MRAIVGVAVWTVCIAAIGAAHVSTARAADLAALREKDVVKALKSALDQSSAAAVARLGIEDGYFGDPKVRIPLPDTFQKAEKVLRGLGQGAKVDELHRAINRAAEAAVPEGKALLLDAVRRMTLADAKGILTGGDDAATEYFRRTTAEPLAQKFLPIVTRATEKVGLARKYDDLAGRLAPLGLVRPEDAKLDQYVTRKALDGLFRVMAEEEKKIRDNPAAAAGSIVRRIFGALKKP